MLTVRTPASSANLGPGFDCLGLSLPLYTTLRVTPAATAEVVPQGDLLAGTPADESNYVYRAMQAVARRAGRGLPPLRLEITTEIPLARGLGSSAAALVAGAVAANEVLGRPLDAAALLDHVAAEEGHPDNVAPALLGGVVVATTEADGRVRPLQFGPPAGLAATLLIPGFELSTAAARAVMPDRYSAADTYFSVAHAALATAALMAGRLDLLGSALQDRLHQPYRASLVPGLEDILAGAPQHGALAAVLSGAGPSVLCLRDDRHDSSDLHTFLRGVMKERGVAGQVLDLPLDLRGTQVGGQFGPE